MTLRSTAYVCQACRKVTQHRHPEDELPRRRWVLRCSSSSCKGARRPHHPQRRPITGRYR